MTTPVNQQFYFGTFQDFSKNNSNVLNFNEAPNGFLIPSSKNLKISTMYFKFNDNSFFPEFSVKPDNRNEELKSILEYTDGIISPLMVALLGLDTKKINTRPSADELQRYAQQLDTIIKNIINKLKIHIPAITNNSNNNTQSIQSLKASSSNTEGYGSASSAATGSAAANVSNTSSYNNQDVESLEHFIYNNSSPNGGSRRLRKNKKARTNRRRSKSAHTRQRKSKKRV